MALNKVKGNMYPWATHTWNPIRGNCPHQCSYCYMKVRGDLGAMRLVEKELELNLGNGKTIFVGSSTDMWADAVPAEWIGKVLEACRKWSGNIYVFQTKNPARFKYYRSSFPERTMLGTTLESNTLPMGYSLSKAPTFLERWEAMKDLDTYFTFVSIEPILDFNLIEFGTQITEIKPNFISIGADSQGHKLPEPPPDKIKKLIAGLQKFTEVKIKPNLKRLLK